MKITAEFKTLTAAQREIVLAPQRFCVLVAGRRWGKGVTARAKLSNEISKTWAIGKKFYWYIAQSYGRAVEEFNWWIREPFVKCISSRSKTQPYPQIEFRNGTVLGFRSFDRPDNLVGSGLDGVVFDEAGLASQHIFSKIIRPIVSDKRGWILFIGTFRGLNWFYDLYGKGRQHSIHVRSFLYPTPTGYAFQSPAGKIELELMKSDMSAREWDEECLCLPAAKQMAAFRSIDIEQCIHDLPYENNRGAVGRGVIIGWDNGKAYDPSGVVVLTEFGEVLSSQNLPLGQSYKIQLDTVAELAYRHHAAVVIDSTGAGTHDSILDFARSLIPDIRGLQWKGKLQEQLMQQLELDLQNRVLTIPKSNTELIRQLREYERHSENGRTWFCAPRGQHDDLVAALAMANYMRVSGVKKSTGGLALSNALW